MKIDLSKENKPRASFSSFRSLFENENIKQLPIDLLVPFENQPFKLYSDDKLNELAADIKENGVLSPVIVRPMGDKYQILSGHNRTNAGKLAGLKTMPCIIKECDDKTAQLIMVNSNLMQREKLLPSERAFAYKIQKECETVTNIAAKESQDRRQIQRYLRLTHLNKPLLDMVDSGAINLVAGVSLSYLSPQNQQILIDFVKDKNCKISAKAAEAIKNRGKCIPLTDEFLVSIFEPKVTKKSVAFKLEELEQYFPGADEEEIKENIFIILNKIFNK